MMPFWKISTGENVPCENFAGNINNPPKRTKKRSKLPKCWNRFALFSKPENELPNQRTRQSLPSLTMYAFPLCAAFSLYATPGTETMLWSSGKRFHGFSLNFPRITLKVALLNSTQFRRCAGARPRRHRYIHIEFLKHSFSLGNCHSTTTFA